MILKDLQIFIPFVAVVILSVIAVALVFRAKGLDPVTGLVRSFRRQPGPVKLFLVLFVGILIAHGSSKSPTNAPPLGMSAPRRTAMVARNDPWYTGTNETWNFDCPDWAAEIGSWGRRGAYADWYSCGSLGVMIATGQVISGGETFDVFDRPLAVVPWAVIGETNLLSRVWYGRAPWGAAVYTWQNAHVDRDATNVISVQFERLASGDRIYRYGNGDGVTTRAYLSPRQGTADSDGDGVPDVLDSDFMDPDADGDGLVDGMTRFEYDNHPLWRANNDDGEPMDVHLNEPVVPPARAVLTFDTLRILLTTNAVYHLNLQHGVKYDVKLTTNGLQPVNLSAERGED